MYNNIFLLVSAMSCCSRSESNNFCRVYTFSSHLLQTKISWPNFFDLCRKEDFTVFDAKIFFHILTLRRHFVFKNIGRRNKDFEKFLISYFDFENPYFLLASFVVAFSEAILGRQEGQGGFLRIVMVVIGGWQR